MKETPIIKVDARDIMFLIHRDRDPKGFAELKESIRQAGQRTVLKVQDISNWKPEKRRRPDGGLYKWRAAFGEGRSKVAMALYQETHDKDWLKLPAEVVRNAESEMVGMSMTENMLRKGYSWQEQARLMKRDIEEFPLDVVARGYSVSVEHLKKVLGILQKLNPRLERELKKLTIAEAESLTSLPQSSQEIVIQVMQDEGLRESQLPAIVRKARELELGSAELSKTALKASLRRVSEELQRGRETVKPLRLHASNGPANLYSILTEKKYQHIKVAIDAAGISYDKFMEAYQE